MDGSGKEIILGIDPGINGAWVMVNIDGKLIDFGRFMQRFDLDFSIVNFVMLEKAASRPRQGAPATFTYGTNYGIWQGHIESHRLPFEFVTPQRWQKRVLDFVPCRIPKLKGETDKEASQRTLKNRNALKEGIAAFAARRYPELCQILSKKKNWDVADALCIALYGIWRWKNDPVESAAPSLVLCPDV